MGRKALRSCRSSLRICSKGMSTHSTLPLITPWTLSPVLLPLLPTAKAPMPTTSGIRMKWALEGWWVQGSPLLLMPTFRASALGLVHFIASFSLFITFWAGPDWSLLIRLCLTLHVCVNGEDRRHAREISGGGKEQEEEFQEEPTVDEEERVESKRFHLAMMSPPMTTTLMFILNYAIISFHGQPSGISWGNHIETAEAAAILAMANRELRSRELLLWTSGSTHLLLQPILPLPLCLPFPLVPASIFKKMMLPLSAFSFWM